MTTDILSKIVKQKEQEISKARCILSEKKLAALAADRSDFRPFFDVLKEPDAGGVNLIAEVKRASPSKGDICADLNAPIAAAAFEKGGASAVSVLTDFCFFKGSLEDLKAARAACSLPVMRKEFIVSRYQVYEACVAGADAILLIARILTPDKLAQLYDLCRKLRMDALVEIHTFEEARWVADSDVRLIGINNRNLSTFETDIDIAMELASQLAPGQVPVAASGISRPEDIRKNLDAGIFNFLVGESIVRSGNSVQFIQALRAAGK